MFTFLLTIYDIITILNGLVPSFGLLIYTFSVARKDIFTFLIVSMGCLSIIYLLVYLLFTGEFNHNCEHIIWGA